MDPVAGAGIADALVSTAEILTSGISALGSALVASGTGLIEAVEGGSLRAGTAAVNFGCELFTVGACASFEFARAVWGASGAAFAASGAGVFETTFGAADREV